MNSNTLYVMCECTVPDELIHNEILSESQVETATGRTKVVTIDTVLQSFEVMNWNRRIYGKDVVMDAINNDPMIQNDIKMGQWVGEYGHPLDTSPKRQVVFNPTTASHRILNYRTEGNLLKGHVQTLAEGAGSMMTSRILQGMPAAFSLRSLGTIDMETRRVNAPLKVITYDSVYRPSHIEAYQDKILVESAGMDSDPHGYLLESCVFAPVDETIDQINKYIAEKSTNVRSAAEMFNLDKLNVVLAENGYANVIVDKSTVLNVPIETTIRLQYHDVLSKGALRLKRRGG